MTAALRTHCYSELDFVQIPSVADGLCQSHKSRVGSGTSKKEMIDCDGQSSLNKRKLAKWLTSNAGIIHYDNACSLCPQNVVLFEGGADATSACLLLFLHRYNAD